MAVRRPEGAALLVAGYGAPGVGAFDASAVHTLGQIGEALLATGTPWQIRRLTATAGDRNLADRRTIKKSLMELATDPVRVAILVVLGRILELDGELVLATGDEAHEYPEDATLPLAFIRDRLETAKAEQLVVAVSARGDGGPLRWLGALGTERPHHVIAVDAPESGNPMLQALLVGLCGDALDPRTGTVTMASLSTHLAKHAQTVQPSSTDETIAQPPPLAGLWDVRRSQLGNRPRPVRGNEHENLTGTVLPGRFRLDRFVARGTFGTVYRARQLAVERDVAVKVLHGDIDPSSEDGKLFVHEIRNVGRIDHANVVRIYQADITHDGRLFFAMELLDGIDLEKLGREGRLPKARAIELVRQLLSGLGAAHDSGLVHADIKPANAIVVRKARTPDGDSPDVSAGPDGSADSRGTSSEAIRVAFDERVVLVDFGLARLRAPDRPAESAGGTPAYMAPEQLNEGRVDARSDLFSAALVLVWLVTGWRRPNAVTLVPPLDLIEDPDLRAVLTRALEKDPAKRYQSARDFTAALTGTAPVVAPEVTPLLPFRHLAPMSLEDRGRLHGRETDLALITEQVLYRRSVIYTAPSGTGKTSLLLAGLMPRLEALGIHAVYHRCRADNAAALVASIDPKAKTLAAAIESFHTHRGGKLVIIVDQLEAALADSTLVSALLGFEQWPRDADVSIVLSVREDYLARLVAHTQAIESNIPVVRLPPLSPEGARTAIVTPLTEARLTIEPELLDALLADFERAAAAIGPEMGWGATPAVYPPHLQLACSVLYEALAPGETTIKLDHYTRHGGFDAIVGEHLDRVIETELHDGRDLIARDLFVALVTSANERAVRPESELLSITNTKHAAAEVLAVLEILRSRGLLVRVRGESEPCWELIHDSLIPRVLSWIDRKDLARRRAIELVRHHLRRSTPEAPSLLSRRELRELKPHPGAITELDEEWKTRPDRNVWTPTLLVARSRQALRRRFWTITSIVTVALSVGGFGVYRWQVEEQRAREQASLRDRDLGRFVLSLELFDWDPVTLKPTPIPPEPGQLTWTLHSPDAADIDRPGPEFDGTWVARGEAVLTNGALVEHVESHGGTAFLVVDRGACSASIVPLRQLPGYAQRDHAEPTLRLRIPTCRASHADMIAIPEGPFFYGGVGEPPSPVQEQYAESARERRVDLPTFFIDRTEVSNAAFAAFAEMGEVTGIHGPSIPRTNDLQEARLPRKPVAGITWVVARSYCRFLGKELPTSEQWVKALRGGERLPDGQLNPMPRRNLPWGKPIEPPPVALAVQVGADLRAAPTPDVGNPKDASPYGVLDLAAGVTEWTSTAVPDVPGTHIVRGGTYGHTTAEDLIDFVAIENRRANDYNFLLGMRCARNKL